MKGDIVPETLWIILLSVMVFIIIFIVVPKFWKDMALSVSNNAPNVVIRDIASLITISGAAPNKITIYYEIPSEQYIYNLDVNGRKLALEMVTQTTDVKGVLKKVTDEIPIDPYASIVGAKKFVIQKIRENDENIYEVDSS
jgi:hypothetical protein